MHTFKNPAFDSYTSEDQNYSNFFTDSELPSGILSKASRARHPPINNYTQLKTIIEDSEAKIQQNYENTEYSNITNEMRTHNYNNYPMPNVERYRVIDASTHELSDFKLMDLRDVTPKHHESSNEDEYEEKKEKKQAKGENRKKFGSSTIHKQQELKKTIAEIDNILKIGSILNQEDSGIMPKKVEIKERTKMYSQDETKVKPRDPPYYEHKAHNQQNNQKRKEIEEARKKYEQITNEIYNTAGISNKNGKNNNKSQNLDNFKDKNAINIAPKFSDDSSFMTKTQETHENYGKEEPRLVPYMFPVEASKNLKNQMNLLNNYSNNNYNNFNKNEKNYGFSTNNNNSNKPKNDKTDDILGFDGVYKLNTNNNRRIFEKKEGKIENLEKIKENNDFSNNNNQDFLGLICFDCQKLIETSYLEEHLSLCAPIKENSDRVLRLPKLNQEELQKLDKDFERNLTDLQKFREKIDFLTRIRPFADSLAQFRTIQINSNFLILLTALKQLTHDFIELENIRLYVMETGIVRTFKSLENLSKAKALLLKYQINSPEIRNSTFYKNQLYDELRQLDLETMEKERELEELAKKEENDENFDNEIESEEEIEENKGKIIRNYNNNNNNSWTNYSSAYEAENERANGGNEKRKREFYSEAVRIKLGLPNGHRGRDVVISEIYDECNKLKLEKKSWETFIRDKLKC